ncbi:hypothetical protein [Aquabacterium humicola]|uniref:hypothetical protein n=1 Tax=Aquabacterium humicola TaxID=3237377 RepID=UPI002542BADF|nr:hypothetical protein [Rubrivivax pictus]
MFLRLLLLSALAFVLPARAQSDASPAATALIADTAFPAGQGAGLFFHLAEVDGQPVADDAVRASLFASRGRGRNMVLVQVTRSVPSGRHRLKVVARTAFSAPIESLFRAAPATFEGVLEVDLAPYERYQVAGALDAFRRELWIERAGGEIVGQKLIDAGDPDGQSAEMAGAAYTCCNLHYDGDWISDANWSTLPLIPAGARIVVKDWGRHRAHVLINGRPMRIGLDYGRERLTREQLLASLMVKDDPRVRLATFPEAVQRAVRAGLAMVGMTREQALMALGPPRADQTPSLDALRWTYFTQQEDPFVLVWDGEGRIVSIEADPAVTAIVVQPVP